MRVQDIAIGIFCKTPIPGHSKTRLSPPLRPEDCAAISACFIRDLSATVDQVAGEGGAIGYAAYRRRGTEPALPSLLPSSLRRLPQWEEYFGIRRARATGEQ